LILRTSKREFLPLVSLCCIYYIWYAFRLFWYEKYAYWCYIGIAALLSMKHFTVLGVLPGRPVLLANTAIRHARVSQHFDNGVTIEQDYHQ
jgi:hypothetical protein